MLIVLLCLITLAVIIAIISFRQDCEITFMVSSAGAVLLGIGSVILILWIVSIYINGFTIDEKINMYQVENKNIEEQITTIVNQYQGYEKDTISNIADMEVILIKIPELKSSELVKKQIDIYVSNNNKMKELKETKIDMKIGKWLLYFGN